MTRANPNRWEASASRTAMLKSRVGVDDVLAALGLATNIGDKCPADHCGAFAIVKTKDGNGWRCGACGASGDIFNLVMLKLDRNFRQARDWIEERVTPKRKDARTGDLFGKSAHGSFNGSPEPVLGSAVGGARGRSGSGARNGGTR